MSALIWALQTGHIQIAKDLIREKADVNYVTKNQETALKVAMLFGDEAVELVSMIIDSGAQLRASV